MGAVTEAFAESDKVRRADTGYYEQLDRTPLGSQFNNELG